MPHENLGPAERIITTLLNSTDHMVHNRPGVTFQAPGGLGVCWEPATYKEEGGQKAVYCLRQAGKRSVRVPLGTLQPDGKIQNNARGHGALEYRPAGLFPEVAVWFYRQVADVWQLDNDFAAHWASFAFGQEHRDLKVVLAAFMLVQARKGDPVLDAGKIAFYDEDYRDVGEAMMLLRDKAGKKELNPKLLLRIRDVLMLPGVAAINHELGFGQSARHPFLGRWPKAVEKWLRHREENPRLLTGLIKAGFRTTVISLAQRIGYKPTSPKFFEVLRWKQTQAEDGRRSLLIGQAVKAADTWEGLTEAQVCKRIVKEHPDWKRIVGLLPSQLGVTRAIMSAAVEAGSLSNRDLIILTPTLEELGLLEVPEVKARWEKAVREAEDMRATNVARNVKSKATREKLQEAADTAVKKVVEKVTRNMRVYFFVDISGSMQGNIELAKTYIAKFLQGFPPDRIHIAVFNTTGREIALKHPSAAGVENAFRGITAGGGTDYGAGVRALQQHKPQDGEDVLFFFVGDEEAGTFEAAVRASALNPLAFGFLKTVAQDGAAGWRAQTFGANTNVAVRNTAANLGIPCFLIEEKTFEDPYAIPRTIRALIAATPIGAAPKKMVTAPRVSLVEQILKTELLKKPAWAA